MKALTILAVALALFIPAPAQAADVLIFIPDAVLPFTDEICEVERLANTKPDTMTPMECLEMIVKEAVTAKYLAIQNRNTTRDIRAASLAQAEVLNNIWPDPLPDAACGDDHLDPEYGEECDDGNTVDNDGCDSSCTVE